MDRKPSSDELEQVLVEVREYPVTGKELAAKAEEVGAEPEISMFFEAIGETRFDSEAEVLNAAEQLDDPDMTTEGDTGGYADAYSDDDDMIV